MTTIDVFAGAPAAIVDGSVVRVVGVAEIAEATNARDRTYVSRWWRAGKLPDPQWVLSMGPVWIITNELVATVERLRR